MLDLAERLEDAGHAYRTDHDNLYYEVGTFEDYGKLSGNSLDDLRAGHRTAGHVEHDKRDPADFALWKSAGEQRALKWPSRWGEGFPGWHLECSAMALKYLGERFDIHTGGIDNVFPHHEDEIAQSAPLVGGPPATVWVHGEHLLMSGRKMAKSAGNFERVTELAERGIDPLALRYLALTSRYRHKLDYSDESVTGAAAALELLRARLRALGPPPADGPWAAPAALRAAPAGERPDGIAADPGGHGGADTPGPADRAHAPSAPLSPEGRDAARPLHGRHRRRPGHVDGRRHRPRDAPSAAPRGRAPLAAARFRLRARTGPRPRLGNGDGWPTTRRRRFASSWRRARSPGTPATSPRADALRDELAALGWDVVDGPDGSQARPKVATR